LSSSWLESQEDEELFLSRTLETELFWFTVSLIKNAFVKIDFF
jgi:hypothetical protein